MATLWLKKSSIIKSIKYDVSIVAYLISNVKQCNIFFISFLTKSKA